MKWQWNREGHHSLHIHQMMSAFILGLLQDRSKEGRGEGQTLPRIPRKAQMSRVLSHVSWKPIYFRLQNQLMPALSSGFNYSVQPNDWGTLAWNQFLTFNPRHTQEPPTGLQNRTYLWPQCDARVPLSMSCKYVCARLHTVMRTREVMRVCFILYVLFLTCFQYVAVVKELLNTGRRTNYDTNWSLHHVKGRKREVKERKEEEEAEEWRKRNEKDGREGRLCVKGQNVMSLINYSICHEKKQDEIFSPHCPFIERDTLCSKDGGKRHEDKTGLKIHQRDGQISSSGQLAGRNSFFSPQLLVSMEGSPFVCQTHAFILFCYFLYTVCTPHTRAHTLLILTWTSYIPATPVSVPVISLYACQHTYVQAEHTHRHTHSHPYEHWLYMPAHKWYKSNPHMNCFHFISSQLLPSRWLMWLLVLEEGSL